MASSLRIYPQSFLLFVFADALKSAFSLKNDWRPSKQFKSYNNYRQTAYHLRRKGIVTISKNSLAERFLQLTKEGELELLLAKTWLKKPALWDGKWRIIIFDIPEEVNTVRDKLRRILLAKGCLKLQASVYISPYPLNRAAILYLKTSGLITFIRIGRLEELDDDSDLRKKFNL